MSLHQRTAWIYFFGFLFVVVITHFPGLTDEKGRNFGLFVIDPIDDVIHVLSGLLALFVAWYSPRLSRDYLVAFGGLYLLDAVVALLIGLAAPSLLVTLAANMPHLLIGSVALAVGLRPLERRV